MLEYLVAGVVLYVALTVLAFYVGYRIVVRAIRVGILEAEAEKRRVYSSASSR